jgi:hypothetical protein
MSCVHMQGAMAIVRAYDYRNSATIEADDLKPSRLSSGF